MSRYKASEASKDPSSAFKFGTLTKTAATRHTFTEVAAVAVTKIAIGNPHPIPAKEKKLAIEPSILRKYDVYWLELAINPQRGFKKHDR